MRYTHLVLAGGLAMSGAVSVAAGDRPTVVELFTSQGCSSCPPAEALLVDLVSTRRDVLALAFHVDYWDRLGWKDVFSSSAATQRQRLYASALGSDQVYTPQMVVDGQTQVLGSDSAGVLASVSAASSRAPPAVPLRLMRQGEVVTLSIGAGRGAGRALLIGFDPRRETAVRRGENAGRSVLQANVVRSFEPVAEWRGQEVTLTRPMPEGESAALVLQSPDGRILGATLLGG